MSEDFQKCLQEIRYCAHPNCVICKNSRSGFPHLLFNVNKDGVIKANFRCGPNAFRVLSTAGVKVFSCKGSKNQRCYQ